MKKVIILLLFTVFGFADGILSEVQKNGLTLVLEHNKTLVIDREMNVLCTKDNINPSALFGGNHAGDKVAKVCKKSFVTKVGVLQPMNLAKEIKTVGELEVLAHIKQAHANPESYVLVDARTVQWFEQMTIPTSLNLPFDKIHYDEELEEDDFENADAYEEYVEAYKKMFKLLNIKTTKKGLDFTKAKSAIFFCNGSWCSQSPNAIYKLMNIGYPKKKLLWYRGGLQDWLIYDFTVEKWKD